MQRTMRQGVMIEVKVLVKEDRTHTRGRNGGEGAAIHFWYMLWKTPWTGSCGVAGCDGGERRQTESAAFE